MDVSQNFLGFSFKFEKEIITCNTIIKFVVTNPASNIILVCAKKRLTLLSVL